ncbi:PTS sugar transporter subunit IIA [Clostridium niameyense]|uniref:PTS sugar transporter subunit IIA n=1 Tax=Clostridium niameyense TaxID=1622073 RepID=UPI000A496108|nr:fructose PTS transporter subunit IIA [Clostridium niameyense]
MNKLFNAKFMDLDLQGTEKFEVVSHLANLIDERLIDVDKYIEDVKKREGLSTTGIGDGVAIPHAKSAWVKEPTVVVGKSSKGIEWESLDDEPVNLVFLIAVPEKGGDEHLKILQILAVSLMDDEFKEKILNTSDKDLIEKLLIERTNR